MNMVSLIYRLYRVQFDLYLSIIARFKFSGLSVYRLSSLSASEDKNIVDILKNGFIDKLINKRNSLNTIASASWEGSLGL